jgi:hypothetical protein
MSGDFFDPPPEQQVVMLGQSALSAVPQRWRGWLGWSLSVGGSAIRGFPADPRVRRRLFFSIHGFGVSFETEREQCVQADPDRDLQIIIGAGQNLIEGVVEPRIADFIGSWVDV